MSQCVNTALLGNTRKMDGIAINLLNGAVGKGFGSGGVFE